MSNTEPSAISASLRTVRALAQGGMGQVGLAVRRQGTFERFYAVKRLHAHLKDDPDVRRMFLDEARLAGMIDHPGVVSVLDVGEDAKGPYLVMPYIDGLSLSKLMSRTVRTEGSMPIPIALRLMADVARGLHAAHELTDRAGRPLGLVHRDLTPQNILIDWQGTVRITDFGVAKALDQTTKTATGVVKGKLAYLAPEQLQYKSVDRRTDLFVFGIVLFEVLSGRRLYKNREGNDGLRRILHEAPPDLGEERPETPPEVIALLFGLLAKDPSQRPATALEVAHCLEGAAHVWTDTHGPSDTLEDFVCAIADDIRRDNLAMLQAGPVEQVAAPLPATLTQTPEEPAPSAPQFQRRWVGVLVAIALIAAAGSIAWVLGSARTAGGPGAPQAASATTSPPTPASASPNPPTAEPATAEPSSVPARTESMEPTPPTPPADETAESPRPAPARTTEAERASMRRPRRPRPSMAPRADGWEPW